MKTKRLFSLAFIFSAALILSSCTSLLGYSIVLWNIDEPGIADGTIVPVYIKSNISHVYVIGVPGTKEKTEVPLWKLTEPQSKSKTTKLAERYEEYQHQYAKCVFDGLPIRSEPVNTSKQVYRLRKDEVIRTMYEGKGAVPTNGKSNLEGKWLRVLTSNGTEGWCFSHNLRLFTMNADGTYGEGAEEAQVQEADSVLEAMLSSRWYPDYYSGMISSGNIDPVAMRTGYGFDTGASSGIVSVHSPVLNVEYPFAGVTKTDEKVYRFKDTPIQVTVRSAKSIILQYTDERGMPRSYNFITLADDISIESVLQKEANRRIEAYNSLRTLGPDFRSSNYGTLTFTGDSKFEWHGFNILVPGIVSRSAKGNGLILIQYYLPRSLKAQWDGVLSFQFEGMNEEVNFLYKKEANGLRLSQASVVKTINESTNRTTVNVSQPVNALVIFFQK